MALAEWEGSVVELAGNGQAMELIRVNETATDALGSAHLLKFDSIYGAWQHDTSTRAESLLIDDQVVAYNLDARYFRPRIGPIAISSSKPQGCIIRSQGALQAYFDQGVKKVIVAAPTKRGPKYRLRCE